MDPKIDRIRDTLESRGFDVETTENGISVMPDSIGVPGGSLEFYTLKKNPTQIRARLGKKLANYFPDSDKISALCMHSLSGLEYTRSKLKEGLLGVAGIGRFYYFGCRNDIHYYYACVTLAEEPEEEILRSTLTKKALHQLNGVDSKIFRTGLDTMGLPRSSLVRLALTRIFRGATDSEEFLNVLSEEANRIAGSEEWKYVRELAKENKDPFLSYILLLLWEEISRIFMKKAWETLHN